MKMQVRLESHADKVKEKMSEALWETVELIGIQAEKNANLEITSKVYDTPESPNYVRTGRLRNSITYAVAGKSPHITGYADAEGKRYAYSGTAPKAEMPTVYIGTNVEYAAAVELGASNRMKPRPYLKPAATNYTSEYKLITETVVAKKM